MILLLHHRYRHPGGEERAVRDLQWLIRSHLGEDAEILERDSAATGAATAARGMLTGGIEPQEVASAVRRTGARIVHAHNLHPTLGWRALQAAREAGARTVLHLHNYRLVCAVGTCFTRDGDCTRCRGVRTLPGVVLNCRGTNPAEAAVYAAGLSLQQRRIAARADVMVVPSRFALERLRTLEAPDLHKARAIPSAQRRFADRSRADAGTYALAAGRLTPEKGFADAIAACERAGVPLTVAGDGPARQELEALAGPAVRFTGRVSPEELDELRAGAALGIVPSRYEEIFPLAAAESMAAALPTVAARRGGLADFVLAEGLAGTVDEMAERIRALYGDAAAGDRALARGREVTAPERVAAQLRDAYDAALAAR